MSELEYYTAMLSKIQRKPHELYAVSRIVHRLSDPTIEIVAQQMARVGSKLYLLDLYFPQFEVGLEVDEPHHIHQLDADAGRQQQIVAATGMRIVRLDLSALSSRAEFDEAIDAFIDEICSRKRALEQSGRYQPFVFGLRSDPEFWMSRGRITTSDSARFRIKPDVTRLFGYQHKAYQRATLRLGRGRNIWFPVLKQEGAPVRKDWANTLLADGSIEELRLFGDYGQRDASYDAQRIVFARFREPVLGTTSYRFLGVYETSVRGTERTIFRRIGEVVELPATP